MAENNQDKGPASALRVRFRVIIIGVFGFIALSLFTELFLRLFFADQLNQIIRVDERNLAYRHDPDLGWFPIEDGELEFTASRTFHIRHNSLGFRDGEFGPKRKPRIAFIGDSFVWGFDVNKEERFTEIIQSKIPEWQVLNLGVSGYGTDQEFLLLQKFHDQLSPDIVFLIFNLSLDNDTGDNRSNSRYGGYFKPYFVEESGELQVKGRPVPDSPNYYILGPDSLEAKVFLLRAILKLEFWWSSPAEISIPDPTLKLFVAIRDYVHRKGGKFAIGFEAMNDSLRQGCTEEGFTHVDLSNEDRYPEFGKHWTPQGHLFVAEKILGLMKHSGWVGEE
ncbi:MAG: SGNH/GDSL hydrolase family protein [Planctomycetota bacterium]|nr:SGNH/GDSL hydrolase family protein [Planctomycetota bacterium]MDA1141447.1 SGNH/GDSL hydrolase family protein [Planctomycetota bacterium]